MGRTKKACPKYDTSELIKWIDRIDSDDIKIKERIKNELIKNKDLIYLLNNKELEEEEASPGDYYGVNILPYYNIAPTQTNVQNFVCFETQWTEEQRYNNVVKLQQIVFYILCHVDNIREETTMLARHDLIAALITDQFNWTNIFGRKIHVVSSRPSTVDNDYVTRTLIFEQNTPSNVVKSTNKTNTPRLANKDVVLYGEEE